MVATKDHLQNAIEDLGADNFKRFISKLCDRREEPRVRRAKTDKVKDAIDLADLLVNTFTTTGAVSVTVEILKAIGSNEIAKELTENTGHGLPEAQPQPPVPAPASAPFLDTVPAPVPALDTTDLEPGSGQKFPDIQSEDWSSQLRVTLCSQEFKNKILQKKRKEIYEIKDKSVRKRLALLINNIDFDNDYMKRRGAEKDEENMEWLLKELDYQVVTYRNLSAQDMEKAVKEFALRKEHAFSDSTFVVIMSHGKRDAILGVHYDKITNPSDCFLVDNIYRHLNSQNCPALRDKPKVILIQACRGGEDGRFWATDGEPEELMEIEGDDYVHKEKDFISLMSCTPDTKSYRHVKNGTFYVQNVVDVFMKCAHEDHIDELFRKVIQRFDSTDAMGRYRQMACKDRASMPKLFYLFPGL